MYFHVLANNHINHKIFSICFLFSFQFFLQLMHIMHIIGVTDFLLENALFCRRNARLKNRLFCSKFCRQNLSKPIEWPVILTSLLIHKTHTHKKYIKIGSIQNKKKKQYI